MKLGFNLRVVNQDYFNTLSNIKVTVNGVTKDYVDGGVKFDNVTMLEKVDVSNGIYIIENMEDYSNKSGNRIRFGKENTLEL